MNKGLKMTPFVLALSLALLAGCFKGERFFHPAAKSLYNIPYAQGLPGDDLLKLDVHMPQDRGQNLPVIVYIHGGGWTSSDKSVMEQWCRRMADRGYLVFNVNYRLAPKHQFPTGVNDCLGAMYWITEHAAEYGGDAKRIGVTGGSAGGHLTAMVGSAWDDPHFKPTGYEDQKLELSGIKCQVPFFGVFDFERGALMKLTKIPKTFLGGSKKEVPENYKMASPVTFASRDAPPTLLIVGGLDPIYDQTIKYQRALKAAGAKVELKVYPFQTHGFDFQFWRVASKDAFERMMKFFDGHLK